MLLWRSLFLQETLCIQGGHAAGAGAGDRLAVVVVGEIDEGDFVGDLCFLTGGRCDGQNGGGEEGGGGGPLMLCSSSSLEPSCSRPS